MFFFIFVKGILFIFRKMKILSLLFFVGVSLSIFAQNVTVYDAYNNVTVDKKNVKSGINNNVQWNYSLIARGAFVITYERKINNYIGAEVGIGPTLLDPISVIIDSDYYLDNLFDSEGVNLKAGFFVSGAVKVYPKEMVDFDGFYVAPTIRYRTYNHETTIVYYPKPDEKFDASLKALDLAMIIGYQYETWSSMIWNFYAGFAWMNKNFKYADFDYQLNEYVLKTTNKSRPGFVCGISFGFSF
jgi:hypothetical protein